ncbi:hypothetical protein DYB30_006553 [Aphanomyces astaci]|uniref:DJ-1/PfpI domain-containing protein n=1 Tax=Aphanomyces astaci TaxID=112090 RepID=A0A397D1L2_APHAT|nr:hypothetical protein DYB34_001761 [Aphanomyces astaci]RHY57149.1 hypothetical protein DYB38_001768 [Aphanomyces astaci]RHY69231.1 hypothetical protein DYB30_006553 [Aphanomyces astaci]RHZ20423.1 hypothetical protein DYB26_014367 [Aphanomyces astaci]
MEGTIEDDTTPTGKWTVGVLLFDEFAIMDACGGFGCRKLFNDPAHQAFILRQANSTKYLLSVCTGAGFLAATGLLDGKRATTNKKAFWEITSTYGTDFDIEWVPHARWVEHGRIWTSSGITAGMDMTHAFLARHFGSDRMQTMLEVMEYTPALDPSQDACSYLTH